MITQRQKAIVFVVGMTVTVAALLFANTDFGSRLTPWGRLLFIPIAAIASVAAGTRLAAVCLGRTTQRSVKEKAIELLVGSAVGETGAVLILTAYPVRRKLTPATMGLAKLGTPLAWLLAVAFTVAWFIVALAVTRRDPKVGRLGPSLSIGLLLAVVIACCEEIIFRAYVLADAAQLTGNFAFQVFVSAGLFALAHIGKVDFQAKAKSNLLMLGWYLLLGAVYACIYVIGGRSVLPVIASHAFIDMVVQPAALESEYRGISG